MPEFIACYSEGSLVGQINFYEKEYLPKSGKVESLSPFKFQLDYEIDNYQDIIEILGYEKPILCNC
jgi:hypothetical protein